MQLCFCSVWAFFVVFAGAAFAQAVTDLGLNPHYAQTPWPSLHRDSNNSDAVPYVTAARNRVSWSALDGAAVLPAPVMGPEGNLYVTTGRGLGYSHLHALRSNGQIIWQSPPQLSSSDLDSGAALSAPLVDRDGVVYVGDRDQFWAFRADGSVKWVSPLPGGPMASAVITREGFVGGITLNGKVVFYDRASGATVTAPFDLPASAPAPQLTVPASLWQGGLLDQALIGDAFQMFLGRKFAVTNTPAVDPVSGRIFVPAAGATEDSGVLYGLDLANGAVSIAFAAPMAAASGTSPALSADGSRVYVVDGGGTLRAFDARTGAAVWTAPEGSSASSPTVAPDNTIYIGGAKVTARNGTSGAVKWSQNFPLLAESILPQLPASPPAFLTGRPVARTSGVISASANHVWVVVALGYEYLEPSSQLVLLQPRVALLLGLSPSTGAIVASTVLRDTSEGIISIGGTGEIYVAHAGFLSSAFYYALNATLPPALRVPAPPRGGFSALRPESYADLAVEGMRSVRAGLSNAIALLPAASVEPALIEVKRGLVLIGSALGAVTEAKNAGQVSAAAANEALRLLTDARSKVLAARLTLGAQSPSSPQQIAAKVWLVQARTSVEAALASLQP